MIPFRGDQFDRFHHGPPVNRPMMFVSHPQQVPQHLIHHPIPPSLPPPPPPSSLVFATPASQFHQIYPGNPPVLHAPQQIFIPNRPMPPAQPWILPTAAPAPPGSMTTYMTSAPIHQSQPPPPPTFAPLPPSFNTMGTSQPMPPSFNNVPNAFKRKSHFLDESDYNNSSNMHNEAPTLMNMPSQRFPVHPPPHHHHHPHQQQQQQQYFRPTNPPPFPPAPPPPPDTFVHSTNRPPWSNPEGNIFSGSSLPPVHVGPDDEQRKILTSQLFQKHQLIPIDTLLKEPGRSQRPTQILIILRGLPGSGKSYVADLIKSEEELQSKGRNKPKILSIDSYFVTENEKESKDPKSGKITKTSTMEYEYDAKMEETYRRSLNKSIRKSIDDRFYPFLILDQNNELLDHFLDLVEYAETHQFRVYFVELNRDVQLAKQRNIHQRSSKDIEQIDERWEQLPLRYEILDIRTLLQSDAIDEVEMDDAVLTDANENENENENEENEKNQDEEEESQITKKSKWEAMMETNPDRLDGISQRRTQSSSSSSLSSPIEKRLNTTMNISEEPIVESSNNLESKKKKVRWADIEENAIHLHKKAVGFIVGQTEQDWQRMSDNYDPSQKLNQYKYI